MGVGVFLLLQPFTHPFRSSPSASYCPRLPFLLSLFTTMSHGTELGFPLRLCSSAQPVCCLSHCKCVSGSPSNFCTSRQSPPLFAIHSAAHLIKRPALFSAGSCSTSGMGDPPYPFTEDDTPGPSMFHCVGIVLLYIPPGRHVIDFTGDVKVGGC